MPDNTNMDEARANTSDIKVHGDPGAWLCLCKASSKAQGWMKSTKVMNVNGGAVVQVSTEHRDPETGIVTACAEAVVFVPDMEAV